MKIRPLEAELFRADGRTEKHDETNSLLSQFCKRAYKTPVPATVRTRIFQTLT